MPYAMLSLVTAAPVARWKDLCIDAADAERAMAFWAPVLGLRPERRENGDGVLRGERPEQTVWVNVVPEPKAVKNRVHLDLVAADLVQDVATLVAAGATHLPTFAVADDWEVLADPEGNELCVFPPTSRDTGRPEPTALVVDSPDPVAIARWWAEVLGARQGTEPDAPARWLLDVPGLPFDVWKFVGVDDPKTVKNRWHWDISADSLDALVTRGASVVRERDDEIRWTVLADPDGNEFCAFTP
jgi:catechol 2,3-dioxygenase-like lactoylglutathione lyase family enzyme